MGPSSWRAAAGSWQHARRAELPGGLDVAAAASHEQRQSEAQLAQHVGVLLLGGPALQKRRRGSGSGRGRPSLGAPPPGV
jgi:hypothetical protein